MTLWRRQAKSSFMRDVASLIRHVAHIAAVMILDMYLGHGLCGHLLS